MRRFKENVTKTLEALRQITNTLNKKGFIPQLANIFFELAKKKDTCESDENRNVMKYIFDMVAKHPNFREMWIAFLKRNALKIEDPYLSAWIKHRWRKSSREERNAWEAFHNEWTIPLIKIETQKQECMITTQVHVSGVTFPKKAIIWNGNGVRARWASNGELKQVIQSKKPDLLCFLEAKIDAEKLIAMEGFEKWVNTEGFTQISCHWSKRDGKETPGMEGILILSKVPFKIKYDGKR